MNVPDLFFLHMALSASTSFRVLDRRVQVPADNEVIAQSPEEGLWSIACDWKERWPADWHHARPGQITTKAEWTIMQGEVNACGGL